MAASSSIRYLLFDLGNVLVDIDVPATIEALKELTDDPALLKRKLLNEGLHNDYETGLLTTDDFLGALQPLMRKSITKDQMISAWNAMLLDFPLSRLEWLQTLRGTYHVGLWSNTNALHIAWVHDHLETRYGIRDFESRYFDKVYYSHDVGLRKPDLDCFFHVMESEPFDPGQILFIDDIPENVAAARQAGMNAIVHDPRKEIALFLQQYVANFCNN